MISVVILTKNSEERLAEVLEAVLSFDDVVVYDTGSEDETLEIANSYPNVSIHQGELDGFGPTRNLAAACAKNDWVLMVDSDEVVSPELLEEIFSLSLDHNVVYSIPRHNQYKGKWIRWCGWYPDRVFRLYHRQSAAYGDARVHESVQMDGKKQVFLRFPLYHYPYRTTEDFLAKMQVYSTLFAKQYKGKKSSSLGKAITHGFFAFFKSYILQRGFLGGKEGFEISLYNGNCAFYKYLKLIEANQELKKEQGP